jgi:FkbM family methyltransferase
MPFLKTFAARLPARWQQELKRLHFARMIKRDLFQKAIENEGEFNRLHLWVGAGDWVLDVGANVGNYSARLSELVQASGRVLAFEPVPDTFELLAANVVRFRTRNVTLFNVAVSDRMAVRGMRMPRLDTGAVNPYMAHLTDESAETTVLCVPIDSLEIQHPIRLIKIDVEGHELEALHGMRGLLNRDHPVLVVEGRSPEVAAFLDGLGYAFTQDEGSPNRVFTRRTEREASATKPRSWDASQARVPAHGGASGGGR